MPFTSQNLPSTPKKKTHLPAKGDTINTISINTRGDSMKAKKKTIVDVKN